LYPSLSIVQTRGRRRNVAIVGRPAEGTLLAAPATRSMGYLTASCPPFAIFLGGRTKIFHLQRIAAIPNPGRALVAFYASTPTAFSQ